MSPHPKLPLGHNPTNVYGFHSSKDYCSNRCPRLGKTLCRLQRAQKEKTEHADSHSQPARVGQQSPRGFWHTNVKRRNSASSAISQYRKRWSHNSGTVYLRQLRRHPNTTCHRAAVHNRRAPTAPHHLTLGHPSKTRGKTQPENTVQANAARRQRQYSITTTPST